MMQSDTAQALRYFSVHNHQASYEILPGAGQVLFSAPHAVLQTRNGQIKSAERYTGMLCRLLHQRYGLPCIYKSRHLDDDANHDVKSLYRDALCSFAAQNRIRYVLDLHQLAPSRPMALCIGTGHGQNLGSALHLPGLVRHIFEQAGLTPVTMDDPFAASKAYTVSATAAAHGFAALQLEINTRLVLENTPDERFEDVLAALYLIAQTLNEYKEVIPCSGV